MESSTQNNESGALLRKVGFFGVGALIFLTVAAAFPFLGTPFYLTKVFIAFLFTVGLLGLSFLIVFKKKKIDIEISFLSAVLFLMPVVYAVATLFSSQTMVSFVGEQLEVDTFAFVLIVSLMAILVGFFVRTTSDTLRVLAVLLFAGLFASLFQVIHIAFGSTFSFLGFVSATDNLVGRWKDLGLLAGLIASLVLITLELLPLQKKQSRLLVASIFFFIGILVLANSGVAWALFGLVALGTFMSVVVQRFLLEKNKEKKTKTGLISGIAVLFAALFLFFGNTLVAPIERGFAIQSFEVRPSIQGTMDIVRSVYAENIFFGTGPNTFLYQWRMHKPDVIVQTPFWNVNFVQGSGSIVTALATGGVLVGMLWLLLIVAILYTIIRALFFVREQQKEVFFVQLLSSIAVLYLLFAHIFYATGQGLTILLFIFIGLLLSSVKASLPTKRASVSFVTSEKFALLFVTASVVVAFIAVGSIYGISRMYVSAYQHEQALRAGNSGDLTLAKKYIEQAVNLYPLDRYYRTAALIDIATINRLANDPGEDPDTIQTPLQNALASGLENSNNAIAQNPYRFQNWMVRGSVISFALPASVEGAYENSLATYEAARLRAPKNPEVDLRIAEVHASQQKLDEAKTFLEEALNKKPNYTEAILLRANIALQEENLNEAIESLQGALFFNPQSAELFYQLGILYLQNESYEEASSAFEGALGISPPFANAAFFLAQAYTFLDQNENALALLQQLQIRNPENELLSETISALEDGRNPFISEIADDATLEDDDQVIK